MSGIARLLWCIIAIAITTAILAFIKLDDIESDLKSRSNAALTSQYDQLVDVEIKARDAKVSGFIYNANDEQDLIQTIENVHGIRVAKADLDIIPTVAPYQFSARQNQNVIELSGSFPSPAAGDKILSLVQTNFPDFSLQNNMTIGQGLGSITQEEWLNQVETNLPIIKSLNTGALELSDNTVSLFGEASTSDQYEQITTQSPLALSGSFVEGSVNIDAPLVTPFVTKIAKTGETSVISGHTTGIDERNHFNGMVGASVSNLEGKLGIARGITSDKFTAFTDFGAKAASLMANGEIALTDNDISITGEASSVENYNELLALTAAKPAADLNLSDIDILPAVVMPYTLAIAQNGNDVTLTGYAASQADKEALLARASQALPGKKIAENIDIARGIDAGTWTQYANYGFSKLADFETAELNFIDNDLNIKGAALNHDTYNDLTAGDGNVPSGLNILSKSVDLPTISPFTTTVSRDFDGNFSIDGYLPNEAARTDLIGSVKNQFGNFSVTDNTKLANGAPTGIVEGLQTAVGSLSRFANGNVSVSDTAMNISGAAYIPNAVDGIKSQINSLDVAGFSVSGTVNEATKRSALDAIGCQARLAYWMGATKIRFASGKATIDPSSQGIIEALTHDINRCEDLNIEIGGHTDSTGDANTNKRLSELRAQAVYQSFIDSGVVRERLSAVGYGQDNPIASNDTEEGREQNRRIEFKVSVIEKAIETENQAN